MVKYILVSGGVLSGLGKGVIASSTGRILRSHGYRVTSIKIDPYINIDAGTMSPFEHGEVFILDDGGEADLDLGNYERFVDLTLGKDNNITTGKIYNRVIEKERRGEYLGKTVQVVPHITNEIQDWIERVANTPTDGQEGAPDICVIELGGTVGDIESMPFVEALRQFQFRVGKENFCLMHVSLVPVLGVVGEQKTKPTQQTVRELRALGLTPDVILCRSAAELTVSTKQKISMFCHVPVENVIGVHDVSNIYRVPQLLIDQGILNVITKTMHLPEAVAVDFAKWQCVAETADRLHAEGNPIHVAMVGKYTDLSDSYLSVIRSLQHASYFVKRQMKIDWIEATDLEDKNGEKYTQAWDLLKNSHAILVPGGFGSRGIDGMVAAARYARENKKPYFGICLGLQITVIELARSQLRLANATSEEFDKEAENKVVVFMPEISKTHLGGTMRLGARKTLFQTKNSVLYKLYKGLVPREDDMSVDERHRHRYEVNPDIVPEIEKHGVTFVGKDDTNTRMEILEIADHPYFVAVQYHPEMKSRPNKPSPPFVGLLLAAMGTLNEWIAKNVQ